MRPNRESVPEDPEQLVDKVRERYARIARGESSSCCGDTPCCGTDSSAASRQIGYEAPELEAVPGGADMGLGCGAPVVHLKLQPGETVLDLGSGGGLDAFLAADQVGETGRVIGVPRMLHARTGAHRSSSGRAGWKRCRWTTLRSTP
jgi:arsenite methyltransferase